MPIAHSSMVPQLQGQKMALTSIHMVGETGKYTHLSLPVEQPSILGTPAKKQRYDVDGKVFYKEVQRTKLAEEYYDGAPAVDIHNHI